jgi:hypothetical protein
VEIEFERSGGFAGILLKSSIDTDKLPSQDREQLKSMVNESDFFSLKSDAKAASAGSKHPVDYFVYKITIKDGDKVQSLQTTELTKNIKLKGLVDYLAKKALEGPKQ